MNILDPKWSSFLSSRKGYINFVFLDGGIRSSNLTSLI